MRSPIPLIDLADDSPIAWVNGELITPAKFLHDVWTLAERLPEYGFVLNLMQARYGFLVGFAAALIRKQISLLPPNRTPRMLDKMQVAYPDCYCLADQNDAPDKFEVVRYREATDDVSRHRDVPFIGPEQTAVISFTSGTTGEPRPFPKTWGGLRASIVAQSRALPWGGVKLASVVGTVPPQHMFGLESTILTPLFLGHQLVNDRPFFTADIRAVLENLSAPRVLVTTPLHIRSLLGERASLPKLEFILSATAPLSLELAKQAEQAFATPVYEIYGCTETGTLASRRTIEGENWKLHDGVSLATANGGIVAKGGHVPKATPLCDLLELVNEQEFKLRGRISDLVNIAGKRASLGDLNFALNEIPGVIDGVFFVPDHLEQGARLTAFVVAPKLTTAQILSALRNKVDEVFLPRPLHLVAALPRTETGKLPREALSHLQATVT